MNYRGVKNKMQRGKMGGVTFGEASPRNSGRLSKWPVKAGSVFVLVAWIFRSRWNQRYHYLNLNGLLDGRSWWPQSRVARWRFGDFITMLWYNRVRNNIRLWVLRDDSTELPIMSGQQPQQQRKQHTVELNIWIYPVVCFLFLKCHQSSFYVEISDGTWLYATWSKSTFPLNQEGLNKKWHSFSS